MSIEQVIRETERMQRLFDSVALSSQVSSLANASNILKTIDTHLIANISDQYSSILKLSSPSFPNEFLTPNIDIDRLNAMLRPSIDFAQQFKEISAPLSALQIDFLQNISILTFDNVLKQLTVDSRIIGEFELDFEDHESSESSEESSESSSESSSSESSSETSESSEFSDLIEAVHQRFETVQFLPVTLLDAIADNPQLMRGMEPRDFEKLVAHLLESLEFENIILTPPSGDGGRDVIATKFVAGIPLLFSFECKRYSNKIGLDIMRGLLGSVAHGPTKVNKGVLVTTSTFTSGAEEFILSEPLVDGKGFQDLVSWLNVYKDENRQIGG